MNDIKLQKHKKTKYLTIMLVPYTGNRVRSVRIPHWIGYVFAIVAISVFSALYYANSQAITFKSLTASVQSRLDQISAEKMHLEREKDILAEEKNMLAEENTKIADKVDHEKWRYEENLQSLEERLMSLEQQLLELQAVKDNLYEKLNERKLTTFDNMKRNLGDRLPVGGPISSDTGLLNEIDSIEQSISAEIEDYTLLSTDIDKIDAYLAWYPLTVPVSGVVTCEMGWRSNPFTLRGQEYHSGMDIRAATGTPVKVTGAGTVSFSGWNSGYGYFVIVDHGYGLQTCYGHNSKLLVEEGDRVNRGDVIAESGSTGRSTGPHVHYEIRLDGERLNPRDFIEEE